MQARGRDACMSINEDARRCVRRVPHQLLSKGLQDRSFTDFSPWHSAPHAPKGWIITGPTPLRNWAPACSAAVREH
eukprot:11169001-Lingulodinium_polyedra.AAC.1